MWTALFKLILFCFVLLCTMHRTFAVVGGECASCGTNEVCQNSICVCAGQHINKGDGTCVSSVCTPEQSACSTIGNAYCSTDTCVCNVLSEKSDVDDATKGSCVLKNCEASSECGVANLGMTCDTTDASNKVCACNQNLTPTDTSCITSGLNAACTGDPQCSGVDNAVCTGGFCKCGSGFTEVNSVCKAVVGTCDNAENACDVTDAECETTSKKCYCPDGFIHVEGDQACKIAVGDDCSGNEEKCVSNAVCGEDDNQCACNEGYTPDGSFCTSPGDRSGGPTQRPFVGGVLVSVVVAALRMLN